MPTHKEHECRRYVLVVAARVTSMERVTVGPEHIIRRLRGNAHPLFTRTLSHYIAVSAPLLSLSHSLSLSLTRESAWINNTRI